jgi:hypothetical protein
MEYRQITLVKGVDNYIFRYRFGEEERLVEEMARCAGDPSSDFDWFDAAVLSYNVNKNLEKELNEVEKELGDIGLL